MSKKYIEVEDKQIARFVRMQIKNNGGYCPSKDERNDDTVCPCLKFREGEGCDCGLYESKRKKG